MFGKKDPQQAYQPNQNTQPKKKGKLLPIILVVLALAIIGNLFGGGDKNTSDTKDLVAKTEKTDTAKAVVNTTTAMTTTAVTNTKAPDTTPKVPTEFKNALAQAKTYSDIMHMSKQDLYDQLVSEYGGKFPAEAAQYAIDNLKADYKKNALEQAKTYQKTMNMSKNAIYDQLISEHGGKFTEEEAQYAVENLGE